MTASYIAKAAAPPSENYYALLFAPAALRETMGAVLAVRHEITTALGRAREPEVRQARLAWWQDEITRLAGGSPAHPLTIFLRERFDDTAMLAGCLAETLGAACLQDTGSGFADYSSLLHYCEHHAGAAQRLLAHAAGDSDATCERYARHLGAGIRLTEILREAAQRPASAAFYLPDEALRQAGIARAQLGQAALPPGLSVVFASLHERAIAELDAALAALPAGARANQRVGLTLAALHRLLLSRLVTDGHLSDFQPNPFLKLWTAWRSARRAVRGVC